MKRLFAAMATVAILAIGSFVSAQTTTTHTMTGTVVTATDQNLVVDTSSGRMTLNLDSVLDRMQYSNLKPGSRIEFTHKTDDQGVLLLTDVRMDPAYSTSDPNRTTTTTDQDTRYAADRLPQTASPFMILAVVGAAALVVGATLRQRNPRHLRVVPKTQKS